MRQVFVGNISYRSTEDTIRHVFEENNVEVERVSIMMDKDTGRSRGFAFVNLPDYMDIDTVIDKMSEKMVDGRILYVEPAKGVPKRGTHS